jgi:hypothetical protein
MLKMKHSRRVTRGPLIRIFAACALFVWLAALTFCSMECNLGHSHSDKSDTEHAVSSPHDTPSPDSDNHDKHDDSLCVSLKTSVHTTNGFVFSKPDFGCGLALSFASPSQPLAATDIKPLISRQPPDRQRVFTPEVSLGPAFRSHAPPLSSFA